MGEDGSGMNPQADTLSRLWNEIAAGQLPVVPPETLDPSAVETLRRLHAADVESAPAPDLAATIWDKVMAEAAGAATSTLAAGPPTGENGHRPTKPVLFGRAERSQSGQHIPETVPDPEATRRGTGRRLWPMVELAAVAALIVALIGGYAAITGLLPRVFDGDPKRANVSVARGGPARTGEQVGPGPAGTPVERWRFPTGCCAPPAPTVADGVVYAGDSGGWLSALDVATGEARWRYQAAGAIGGSPAIADGVVYLGDEAGFLSALDAATGEEVWRASAGISLYNAAPVVVDGVVYLVGGAGATPPAVVDEVVYAGGDGFASRTALLTLAFDAATGAIRWSHDNYDLGNGLFALDANTGAERWHVRTSDSVYHAAPAVAGGAVYVGSKDGTLYALEAATGEERWRFETGGPIYASPAVSAGTVFVASDAGTLHALDATTGAARWARPIAAAGRSSPAVAAGTVFLVAGGNLHALDAANGEDRWSFPTGDAASSPAIAGDAVYVGWADKAAQRGALIALGND